MQIIIDVNEEKYDTLEKKLYEQCCVCQQLHKGKCINENDCVITLTLEMLSSVLAETRKLIS